MSTDKISRASEIYNYIYRREMVSQQQTASDLGLSMPTLLPGLKELREAGLILDDEVFASTGGRKAKAFRIDPMARISIGMYITANHISLTAIDLKGHILCSNRIRQRYTDSLFYYSTVGKLLDSFLSSNRLDHSRILGLGVSLPAIIASDRKTVKSARVLGAPAELFSRLKPHLSLPFLLFNDAKSGGYAEWWDQADDRTIIYLSLNGTVGGALITGGELYTGDNQKSFEFGHVTLVPDGRPCYCGQRGCANAYLSSTILSNMTDGKLDLFFSYAGDHREPYASALREYLLYLAVAVNNLRMQFDCDIVLGGYVGAYMKPHMDDFREMVRTRNRFRDDGQFIKPCRHRYETAAMGAALYFVEQFIRGL